MYNEPPHDLPMALHDLALPITPSVSESTLRQPSTADLGAHEDDAHILPEYSRADPLGTGPAPNYTRISPHTRTEKLWHRHRRSLIFAAVLVPLTIILIVVLAVVLANKSNARAAPVARDDERYSLLKDFPALPVGVFRFTLPLATNSTDESYRPGCQHGWWNCNLYSPDLNASGNARGTAEFLWEVRVNEAYPSDKFPRTYANTGNIQSPYLVSSWPGPGTDNDLRDAPMFSGLNVHYVMKFSSRNRYNHRYFFEVEDSSKTTYTANMSFPYVANERHWPQARRVPGTLQPNATDMPGNQALATKDAVIAAFDEWPTDGNITRCYWPPGQMGFEVWIGNVTAVELTKAQ